MRSAVAAIAVCLSVAACGSLPAPIPMPPEVVHVPVTRYVPVPEEYTRPCTWTRNAPPSRVFEVMEGRRRCLERYETDRQTIRAIQGTPVID